MRTIFGCLALAVAGLGLSLSDSARLLDTSEEANAVGAGVFSRKACVFVSSNGCYDDDPVTPGGQCPIGFIQNVCSARDIYTCQLVSGWYDTCSATGSSVCPEGQIFQCQNVGLGFGMWVLIFDEHPCGNYELCLGAP